MLVLAGNQLVRLAVHLAVHLAVRLAVVPVVLALAGCAATSATQVLIFESSPLVRHYEEVRTRLAEQDKIAGGSIQKGGCPVCTW